MKKELLKAAGEALYGEQWVTPLAKDLDINRKTIQRYNSGELKINQNIGGEVAKLLYVRNRQIQKLRLSLDECFAASDARQKAIRFFLTWNTSKLIPTSKVYCRLRYSQNGYYQADVQLEEPESKNGWQIHQFDEKYFVRDLVNIRKVLSKKMEDSMAVFDENLKGEYSIELDIDDFNY